MLCLVSSPRDILRSINKKQLNTLDPQKVQRPAKHPKELVPVRTFIFFLHNVYHSFCFIEYKNVLLLDHIRKSCYFGNHGMDINWTLITPVETEFPFINIFPRLDDWIFSIVVFSFLHFFQQEAHQMPPPTWLHLMWPTTHSEPPGLLPKALWSNTAWSTWRCLANHNR